MSKVLPPTLCRFCKVKKKPRKVEYYDQEYGARCISYATQKLARQTMKKAEATLKTATEDIKKVFALQPAAAVQKPPGFLDRNKAAAAYELEALRVALRAKRRSWLSGEGRPKSSPQKMKRRSKRCKPATSEGWTQNLQEESNLKRQIMDVSAEAAQLRRQVKELSTALSQSESQHELLAYRLDALKKEFEQKNAE